jgi:hypothetical protein
MKLACLSWVPETGLGILERLTWDSSMTITGVATEVMPFTELGRHDCSSNGETMALEVEWRRRIELYE